VPRPQELPFGVAPMPIEDEPASGEPEAQPARSA
jgi:hypothetical protein